MRINAAKDLELRMQVSQLRYFEAGFNEVCHVMGANRGVAEQQLSCILPNRQRDRESRVLPQLIAKFAEPGQQLFSTGHDLQEVRRLRHVVRRRNSPASMNPGPLLEVPHDDRHEGQEGGAVELEREKVGRLAEVPWHLLTCRLHRLLLSVLILPLRGPGRANEGADRLDGDPVRVARDKLREGRASRGSSAQSGNAAGVDEHQARAGPCELTPWAALRSLAEGFPVPVALCRDDCGSPPPGGPHAGVVRPRPKRAQQSRTRHRAMRRPRANQVFPSPPSGPHAAGEGGRSTVPGVIVLAARRAPWRPHTSGGSGLRRRRMGGTDSEGSYTFFLKFILENEIFLDNLKFFVPIF
jgi:hypothetical protein